MSIYTSMYMYLCMCISACVHNMHYINIYKKKTYFTHIFLLRLVSLFFGKLRYLSLILSLFLSLSQLDTCV